MRRVRSGFSLIELIVTLAAVSLLLGLLAPSLANLKTSARRVACLSNLRQMSIAAQRYALEFAYFPPAVRYESVDGALRRIAWDWVTTFDDRMISPGPLWAYTDDPGRVQQCPAYHGPSYGGDPYTGYNYNVTYLGGESPFPQTGWALFRPGARYGACRRTAEVAVFGDGAVASGVANKFMRAPGNSEGWGLGVVYAGAQAFRHGPATCVAYLDLHTAPAATPFRGEHATDALLRTMGYPRQGFLSDDDRAYDPRWGLDER